MSRFFNMKKNTEINYHSQSDRNKREKATEHGRDLDVLLQQKYPGQ